MSKAMGRLTATSDPERALMSSEELRRRIVERFLPTAVNLSELALDWAELERRGDDLSDLRRDLRAGAGKWIDLIARRRLAAEAVVAFNGRDGILKHLEGMPLDLQRRLADGEEIPVYLPGEKAPTSLPLTRIDMRVLSSLIQDGRILTPKEQRVARASEKKPKKTLSHTVRINKETRQAKIGNTIVSTATIVAAMSDAAGARGLIIDTPEAPAKVIGGKFTDEEVDKIRAASKAHGIAEWEMVRQAVVAMWLL